MKIKITHKVKNIFKIIGLIVFIHGCNPKDNNVNTTCDEYNELYNECIMKFYIDDNYAHLDTALMHLEIAILNCDSNNRLFSLRKLSVLSIKQEYDIALMFIDSFDNCFFKDLPYYKNVLKNRFMAMQFEYNNDSLRKDSCLNIALNNISLFLNENRTQIDSLLVLSDVDLILSNSLSTSFTQYYYYKSVIKGIDPTIKEIRDLQVKLEGNKDFFEYIEVCLEEDFMIFIGI